MPRGSLGIGLILVGVLLILGGIPSVWLGTQGIVINNSVLHFGATATAEINNGLIMISIGAVLIAIFAILFFVKREALSTELPHFP